MQNLRTFSFWIHLNNISLIWIFFIDTVVLSFFSSLRVIGDYTIALKIAFIVFQFTIILEKVMTTTFKEIPMEKAGMYLATFIKYFFLKSIITILAYLLIGKPVLAILFKTHDLTLVYNVGLIIIIAVGIMSTVWPFASYIIAKHNVRDFFLKITAPTIIISSFFYILLTILYGPYGTAMGNIINYSIFAILISIYTLKRVKLTYSWKLDKEITREILKKMKVIPSRFN
jgi:O-antigen/teichoic acid export membrane protein